MDNITPSEDFRVNLVYTFNDLEDVYDDTETHLEIFPNEEALRHAKRYSRKLADKKARKTFLRLRNLSSDDIQKIRDRFYRFARQCGIGGYH